ncbi:MAG: radical SAM protein [Anaerolineae bacterium]|nr:radical SAM protein [Anaerolineae bacterium]
MQHVFGPVPSRRLGQSLGVDPVPPKTCNWNCVYCQLGRSAPLSNRRETFYPVESIVAQVKNALTLPVHIDWLTLVGSGETTLYASLGELVNAIKVLTPLPLAVITNGSLLHLPEVRAALTRADAVLPSLDAGNPALYRRINRPHPEITFDRMVEGLTRFREEYSGKLWVEVMLTKNLNDSEQALGEIATILRRVRLDEIHLLAPTRPPAEPWVEPADEDAFLRAAAILGEKAKIIHATTGEFSVTGPDDLMDSIRNIITRHPMRESEIIETLHQWTAAAVIEKLNWLAHTGTIEPVERYGIRYWRGAPTKHH